MDTNHQNRKLMYCRILCHLSGNHQWQGSEHGKRKEWHFKTTWLQKLAQECRGRGIVRGIEGRYFHLWIITKPEGLCDDEKPSVRICLTHGCGKWTLFYYGDWIRKPRVLNALCAAMTDCGCRLFKLPSPLQSRRSYERSVKWIDRLTGMNGPRIAECKPIIFGV